MQTLYTQLMHIEHKNITSFCMLSSNPFHTNTISQPLTVADLNDEYLLFYYFFLNLWQQLNILRLVANTDEEIKQDHLY